MPPRHVLLALTVVVLWGLNFLAIHFSLEQFPPLFLVAMRFAVLALPALLFVPWPGVRARHLIGYGLGFGTLQFFGLYVGMVAGFPAGLASLVLQASAPMTVLLGALLLGERVTARRMVGIGLAASGLGLVGLSRGGLEGWTPFLLVLLGAFGWALGNIASRQAQSDHPMRLVLWMTVVPPVPMLAISLMVEGPELILGSLAGSLDARALPAWLGLAYTVLFGTIIGSGLWVWLLRRHPAGVVAPFSMLVPVVGILAAWLVLGETPMSLEVIGAVFVAYGVSRAAGLRLRRGGRARRSLEIHESRGEVTMSGDYWYNVQTGQVEQGAQSSWKHLLGPYPSYAEASQAMKRVEENNDAWEDDDARRHWEEDGGHE